MTKEGLTILIQNLFKAAVKEVSLINEESKYAMWGGALLRESERKQELSMNSPPSFGFGSWITSTQPETSLRRDLRNCNPDCVGKQFLKRGGVKNGSYGN